MKKKNIRIITTAGILSISAYMNFAFHNRIENLESLLIEKEGVIQQQKEEIRIKESQYKKIKKLAEQLSAKALESGHRDSNSIQIGK